MDSAALILELTFFLVLISHNGYLGYAPSEISPQEPSEYCNGDEFRARCASNEVIVINEATFGRASVGRCFQEGEQQFGCIANFTEHLDADCSGRRSCTIRVPSATMNAVNTCRPMKSALYASYRCIKVVGGSCRQECSSNGKVKLTGDRGYLSSIVTEDRVACGSVSCPWLIQVLPGQTINLTLFDFAVSQQPQSAAHQSPSMPSSSSDRCPRLMIIKERANPKDTPVCGGKTRHRHLYMSVSHYLELHVLNDEVGNSRGQFLVYYEAVGCPDIVPPKWSRMKRIDNQCEIDCPENPSHKWVLECINNQWVGEVGKCPPLFLGEIATTDKPKSSGFWSFVTSLPLNVLITLVIAVTVIIGVIIITTGIVCLKKNSYKIRRRPESIIYTGASSEFEFRQDLVGANSALMPKAVVHGTTVSVPSSKPRRPSTDPLMPGRDNTYAAERCMESRPLPAIPDSTPQSSIQRDHHNQITVQVHPNVINTEMGNPNQIRPMAVCRSGPNAGVPRDGRRPQQYMSSGHGGTSAAVPSAAAAMGDNHHYFILDPDVLEEEPATLHSMSYRSTENQVQTVPLNLQILPDEHKSGRDQIEPDQYDSSNNGIQLRPIRDGSSHQKKTNQQKFNDSGIGSWP